MTVPDWKTTRAGARIRVALWLRSEVGTGGSFTKAQLRAAFPKIEQVDRRMRDLRRDGWVIATYREDRSLASDELRLVGMGGPVWEAGYRSTAVNTVTDKERRAVFAGDNYSCVYCGISGGETYVDDPVRTAKLSVARIKSGSSDRPQLVSVCDRCRAAAPAESSSSAILADIANLDDADRANLRSWIERGRRQVSPAEQVWGKLRRLPRPARDNVADHIRNK